MKLYEVTVIQSIHEVYHKQFVAPSKHSAEKMAIVDTAEGLDETWKHSRHEGQCDEEVMNVEEVP